MMTMSPGCTFRAAAPLRHITPEPRSPFYDISLESFSIVVVYDGDFFIGNNVRRIH